MLVHERLKTDALSPVCDIRHNNWVTPLANGRINHLLYFQCIRIGEYMHKL